MPMISRELLDEILLDQESALATVVDKREAVFTTRISFKRLQKARSILQESLILEISQALDPSALVGPSGQYNPAYEQILISQAMSDRTEYQNAEENELDAEMRVAQAELDLASAADRVGLLAARSKLMAAWMNSYAGDV